GREKKKKKPEKLWMNGKWVKIKPVSHEEMEKQMKEEDAWRGPPLYSEDRAHLEGPLVFELNPLYSKFVQRIQKIKVVIREYCAKHDISICKSVLALLCDYTFAKTSRPCCPLEIRRDLTVYLDNTSAPTVSESKQTERQKGEMDDGNNNSKRIPKLVIKYYSPITCQVIGVIGVPLPEETIRQVMNIRYEQKSTKSSTQMEDMGSFGKAADRKNHNTMSESDISFMSLNMRTFMSLSDLDDLELYKVGRVSLVPTTIMAYLSSQSVLTALILDKQVPKGSRVKNVFLTPLAYKENCSSHQYNNNNKNK
ncbi:hypothetical protein RFI_03561, partial [Reticulomyxa filosa]